MLGHGAFTDRKESENRLFSVIHRLLGDSLPCRLKHRLNSFVSFLDTLTHHPSSFSLWSTSTSSLNAASAVTKHTFHIENQWHSGVNVKPINRLERVPSPPAVTFWSQNNTKPKIKKNKEMEQEGFLLSLRHSWAIFVSWGAIFISILRNNNILF